MTCRRLILLGCAAALVGCGSPRTETKDTASYDTATVLEVIDGDTVRLSIADREETARLIGIDTPETKHPTKPVECFGPQAAAFLAGLLPAGTTVRVERDSEARDSYRRLLLYVFVDTPRGERFVNLEIVARGYATPLSIEPNVRYQSHFVQASFDAERNGRGLWSSCR